MKWPFVTRKKHEAALEKQRAGLLGEIARLKAKVRFLEDTKTSMTKDEFFIGAYKRK